MKVAPDLVTVLLGRYNLNVADEHGSRNSSISEIIIHPDWNHNNNNFDADIAIVIMSDAVEFSDQIQPVCLPVPRFTEVVGVGTVVGWGKSAQTEYNQQDPKPTQLDIPAVNASYCYPRFPDLADASSHRAFCGGFDNEGKGPCLGDSGGGFYLKDAATSSWAVAGIISASIVDLDHGCDINKFSLYTSVARFSDWIMEIITGTKMIEWNFVEFICRRKRG